MEEEKKLLDEVAADTYDASDRPFDFVLEEGETALVCATDAAVRDKVFQALQGLGFQATEAVAAKDALKTMRFHMFDVVVVDEAFDGEVLDYLESLNMATRRHIFVVLLSTTLRTMDNMAAFNRSVNLVINTKNMEEVGAIIRRGMNDNKNFYSVFMEGLRKIGKL
jgi:DNA-binding NtrC family response regulator